MPTTNWHSVDGSQALAQLDSCAAGLTSAEAQRRLAEYGPNTIPSAKRLSWPFILINQFTDFMIIVLLVAALISGLLGEVIDTIAIGIILLLNAGLGAIQEIRAQHALAALAELAAPKAKVLRHGQVVTLAAKLLVPGEVVVLEAGNIVPADLRLLEVENLQVDESALTGESHSASKQTASLNNPDLPLGERTNLVFMSSLIVSGQGSGVVIASGHESQIGQIAQLMANDEQVKTPLQVRLLRFGRYLVIAVLVLCAVIFAAGLLQGKPALLMLLTAVSLAVAAVPEALPAVVTISLALGARKLLQQHALVRNLSAVETLGSVTYICTDKTGTLTQNLMSVDWVYSQHKRSQLVPSEQVDLGHALALNNDISEKDGQAAGESTEMALFELARKSGFIKTEVEKIKPRLATIGFDSTRKCMTTLHKTSSGVVAYVKGAPESVLASCTRATNTSKTQDFDPQTIIAKAGQLAKDGYRVLALAKRDLSALPNIISAPEIERDLSFLALVALIDPLRPEAFDAVAACKTAGITPVMITGDHPATAMQIARRLSIATGATQPISGEMLAQLTDTDLASKIGSLTVYARVSPEQKLRIVKALQAKGEFVAMTGDGINDAPALKQADIGVAMGLKGTDVARKAADMVLVDDNFATIVGAIEAGRRIFDNIRKFIKDTMSSNSGEVWTLLLAPVFGLPIPLLPIHILWMNLVTDGLPGLAFIAEPGEKDSMARPPRSPQENIFACGMWQHILWVGLLVAGLSLGVMAWTISNNREYWQTSVFSVLVLCQLFHSLAVRSEKASLLSIGLLSNIPMLGAITLAVGMQLALIYLPALNAIFHTQPLPIFDLLLCFAVSSLVLIAVEIEKYLQRQGLIYRSR
ncbi:MAG: Ca2+-transporting ATPase [Paraglaciecola sp.]|jgi:Ca2+-transporting ATPase